MELPTFVRLLSPEGQKALSAAVELQPTPATFLACHQRLRKHFADDLVKAAIETAILRRKAAGKFSQAGRMYFTREALEQSSGEIISTYRSRRYARFQRVGDFCCGIGGDMIGLSDVAEVVALDSDPLRLAMAEENMRAYGRRDRLTFVLGELLASAMPEVEAAFLDPDRRAGGRRHLRLRDYSPALEDARDRYTVPLGVKVAPGAPWDELRTYDAETEFISVAGELKECVLWFDQLKSTNRRATVLPQGASLPEEKPAEPAPAGPPLTYLYDPDPAVVRSGLVANLGQQLEARPIDPEIAYLTSDRRLETPFAQCYRVEEAMPFHARQLGERLRSMNVGPVSITKRGSAVDVDELRRKWKLTGGESRTIMLTKVMGRPFAIIAHRLES